MDLTNFGEECKICGGEVSAASVDSLCEECEIKYNSDWDDDFISTKRIISNRDKGEYK